MRVIMICKFIVTPIFDLTVRQSRSTPDGIMTVFFNLSDNHPVQIKGEYNFYIVTHDAIGNWYFSPKWTLPTTGPTVETPIYDGDYYDL